MTSFSEICHVDVPEGKSGHWKVERFVVPENSIQGLYYALHGRPVPPGTYTRLIGEHTFDPMMSDTPSEIRDHIELLAKAKQHGGRVLLNGLGLGVVLKGILSYPNVTHIDVVELESDVIKLVAPSYPDPRVAIHQASAYDMVWPKGIYWNVVWHDIWPSICSDNLEGMAKLHRKYARRCDWQGSWCESECRRQLKEW